MNGIRDKYGLRREKALVPVAAEIENQIREYLANTPHVDRVSARAKSVESFVKKAETILRDGSKKYSEPLVQIQDQIGARVIVFYLSDVLVVSNIIERYFRPIELRSVVPDSEWSFGYFGKHYLLIVPSDVVGPGYDKSMLPTFFELQIKTLFQHAWSEANHDLGYKQGYHDISANDSRRLAFTSAQAWGADRVFDELVHERQSRKPLTTNSINT